MSAPRRVLVTGAGSGLGKAIAERLARRGDLVVGTVRGSARADELSETARVAELSLRYQPLELTDGTQVERLARDLEAAGGLDLLVQNAGMGISGPIEEVGASAFQRQFAVNLFGPLELVRKVLPMLRARRGRIVFVGSLAGRFALPFQAHYAATKAAIASFSDSLRMELAPYGVRVSCVEPGDFATGFTDAREKHATAGSPYAEKLRACLEAAEGQERGGGAPDWVARVVEALSVDPRPPARQPVGRWARTMCLMQRLLPDFVREWGTMSQYKQ